MSNDFSLHDVGNSDEPWAFIDFFQTSIIKLLITVGTIRIENKETDSTDKG